MLRRNVLIFHAGALGDFVMSWPLALAVGRIFAQSRVIYVTHGEKGKLAESVLGVESLDIEPAWQGLWSETLDLPEPQQKKLKGAAFIFTFLSNGDDLWARNVRNLAPEARIVPLQTRPPTTYPRHWSQYLVEQLAGEPVVAAAVEQMLRSIADRGVGPTSLPREYVLLHPGSGAAQKNWPLERYVALAAMLRDAGNPVHATLGEVELERWSAAEIALLEAAAIVHHPRTYIDLWRVIAQARLVITNDTGPAHLAAITAARTLVLFKTTDPIVWQPIGPNVRAISADSDGKSVAAEAQSLLGDGSK